MQSFNSDMKAEKANSVLFDDLMLEKELRKLSGKCFWTKEKETQVKI